MTTGPIRWGILSTGKIAHTQTKALKLLPDAEVLAVGSRSQSGADAFADAYGIARRYASYQALVDDPDVDVIYVATPHTLHAENTRMALHAGKHVLCEKPFTLNAKEAAGVIALARANKRLLLEAMWVRWLPTFVTIRGWLKEGVIGDVKLVRGNLCFRLNDDPQKRIYNPALGGGALLDVGVYPVSFAAMVLGKPTAMHSTVRLAKSTGVDESAVITFAYASGAVAELSCAVNFPAPQEFAICGTQGYIHLADNWGARRLTLHRSGHEPQTSAAPFAHADYRYQAAEMHACMRAGKLESDVLPLDETLAIMETMDALRAQWGVRYPGE